MVIYWEAQSLIHREKIFEFLFEFNPSAAEATDKKIEAKIENLRYQPEMGVQRVGVSGRLLIISEISMVVSYPFEGNVIKVLRVLHSKQKFPQ